MKRYDLEDWLEESEDGGWVKWDDVKALLEEVAKLGRCDNALFLATSALRLIRDGEGMTALELRALAGSGLQFAGREDE